MKHSILFFVLVSFIIFSILDGVLADQVGSLQIEDEVILGTSGDDKINSGEGNDNISSGEGDDNINGGLGDDLISGGNGNDKITDGAGNDYIIAGDGNDVVMLGDGNDYVNLGPGDDIIVINLADEIGDMNFIDGGEGNDTLIIVMENVSDILANDIIQYFDDKNKVGTRIVDMNNVQITAGISNFEKIGVTKKWTF